MADVLKKKKADLIRTYFPEIDLKFIFEAHNTLGGHFNYRYKYYQRIST